LASSAPMLRMPIAARGRQPSLRYSDRGSCWFGVTGVPGQPASPALFPHGVAAAGIDRQRAKSEFRALIRAAFYYQCSNNLIRKQPSLRPMNRHLRSSPCSPLIAGLGPPDRRKQPPVRPRPQAADKSLIYMALSRITGSNLRAEAMIRPVFRPFTGGFAPTHRVSAPPGASLLASVAWRIDDAPDEPGLPPHPDPLPPPKGREGRFRSGFCIAGVAANLVIALSRTWGPRHPFHPARRGRHHLPPACQSEVPHYVANI